MNQRRKFIKTSALIAGSTLFSPYVLPKAFATGDDVIKIALIGCGGRGTGAVFQAFDTGYNIKLVAMADVFRDRLDGSFAPIFQKYGKDKVDVPEDRKYVGFDAYKEAMKEADVVILTTPPGFRPDHFAEAIRQNKQVFMEKPVAVDAVGIRKVLQASKEAKEKKLNVVVGLQRRYQDNYKETISRINEGAIGDIVSGQVYWNDGGVWVNQRTAGMTEMEYQLRNWYYFNWLCGDHILEQHVHNIDVMNWVKGSYPIKAEGTGGRFTRTGKEFGEIFDHHSVTYTFEDGSVILGECRHFSGAHNRVDESFQGTKGRAYMNAGNRGQLWDGSGKSLYEHDTKGNRNPFQTEHDELFKAISSGEYKFHDADYAAKSTMTAIMGRAATYSGKVISWEDCMASELDLMPEKLGWSELPKSLPNEDGFYPIAVPGKSKMI